MQVVKMQLEQQISDMQAKVQPATPLEVRAQCAAWVTATTYTITEQIS